MKACLWERVQLKTTKKQPLWDDIANSVSEQLLDIWKSASVPTLSSRRVRAMLDNYHTKYNSLMKDYSSKRKDKPSFINKVTVFKEDSLKLFDIAACKCAINNCSCDAARKVPQREAKFLNDQRTNRKMAIGAIDKATTQKLTKQLLRKEKRSQGKAGPSHSEASMSGAATLASFSDSDATSTTDECDDNSEIEYRTDKTPSSTNFFRLPSVALACDRSRVSDRTAASIVSATLKDIGIISPEDASKIVDRSKIRRARGKKRVETKQHDETDQKNVVSIFFDGRKDRTLSKVKKGNKTAKQVITEEHITCVKEPDSEYLGHIVVSSGTSHAIASGITDFLNHKNINTSELQAVGCDGTAVNTGRKNGVISLLEQQLGRPLQWFVCQLHGNELPLRHLITKLDGPTTGPRGFSGTIGKQLSNCENLPIIDFEPIQAEEINIEVDLSDLSTDQKYLLEAHRAVSSGVCGESLMNRNPGKIAHSRWITTANRILRLYMTAENPTENLIAIVKYIMEVYAPMWFKIKCEPSVIFGAKHLHDTVRRAAMLDANIQAIVNPVIQRNAYFGHPENILLSMINDDQKHVRELGWRRILKARTLARSAIRSFEIPELNFNSSTFIDMIKWQNTGITEPPLTKNMSQEEITKLIQTGGMLSSHYKDIPCHTQAVERLIKLVTEASEHVCGEAEREGFIKNTLESRKNMPKFDTKKQFKI